MDNHRVQAVTDGREMPPGSHNPEMSLTTNRIPLTCERCDNLSYQKIYIWL